MSNISRCCDQCEYVASVSVRCPLTKLPEGESIFAWAVVLPYEATDRRVTWSSSDNSIATINPDSGLITAQGVGEVVITATAIDREIVKGTYHLEVIPYVFVESVVIDTKVLVMQPCRTERINRTVSPANATNPHVCWNSSNECVATVDALGFVKALKEGETIITATSTDGTNLSATCRVVVSDLDESVTIVPHPHGNYLTFSCTQPAVCNDGIGNSYGDKYHNSQTAYMNGILNADIHRYIVIPRNVSGLDQLKGCVGVAVRSDGRYFFGVVGEVGPTREDGKLDEFSVKMIKDLGFDTDGANYVDPADVVTTYIFTDTKRSSWPSATLNSEVEAIGCNYFY